MRGAGLGGEGGGIFGFSWVAFAEPSYASFCINVGLFFGIGVAGYNFVVLWDGDFGRVYVDVVCAEAGEGDWCVF